MKLVGFLLMTAAGWLFGRQIRLSSYSKAERGFLLAALLEELYDRCSLAGNMMYDALRDACEIKEFSKLVFLREALKKNEEGAHLGDAIDQALTVWAEDMEVDRQALSIFRSALGQAVGGTPKPMASLKDAALAIREKLKQAEATSHGKASMFETVGTLLAAAIGVMLF